MVKQVRVAVIKAGSKALFLRGLRAIKTSAVSLSLLPTSQAWLLAPHPHRGHLRTSIEADNPNPHWTSFKNRSSNQRFQGVLHIMLPHTKKLLPDSRCFFKASQSLNYTRRMSNQPYLNSSRSLGNPRP